MTKAVYIVRGIAATAILCSSAAAHIRGSYEVLHGQRRYAVLLCCYDLFAIYLHILDLIVYDIHLRFNCTLQQTRAIPARRAPGIVIASTNAKW